ncbi:MAG: Mrp/NBP35 family ATP-binding protein [Spirochaetia bacterium]|nr:Mrp/NBP35 family ATP-binding protein [Spirochaetia bacterium]
MHGTKEEIEKQQARINEKMAKVKNKIVVLSGKGGVGKTSTAVNIACALAKKGKKTAILDTDLHGPNIGMMLGMGYAELREAEGGGIIAPESPIGLKAVSIAMTGKHPDEPTIWRGPMKAAVIRQFLADVEWGNLDYLIVDSPPGTGDEPLAVCQMIPAITGAVIVSTPQDVAVLDARKSIFFAKELNIKVIGVIENMSGFVCPHCGKETEIFGRGGAQRAAKELGVELLGTIPFDPAVVLMSDKGTPVVLQEAETPVKNAFMEVTEKIEAVSR